MRLAGALAGVCGLLLAGCGSEDTGPAPTSTQTAAATSSPPAQPTATPDLAHCQERRLLEEGLRERTQPIPVPPALREVMRADMDNFAVSTLGGATVCVDASWMEQITDAALSRDARFVSFDWMGYEAFGHVIVDRTGKGTVVDTGVRPTPSPSGKRLAALDYSESGYGALNALAVWDVTASGLQEVARQESLPDLFGWRLDGWIAETCLELSGIEWEDVPEDAAHSDDAPRQRYVARLAARKLDVHPASEGGCQAE